MSGLKWRNFSLQKHNTEKLGQLFLGHFGFEHSSLKNIDSEIYSMPSSHRQVALVTKHGKWLKGAKGMIFFKADYTILFDGLSMTFFSKIFSSAYVHTKKIKLWDLCSPNAIVNALGGKFVKLDGHAIDYSWTNDYLHTTGLLATMDLDMQSPFERV